jgi:hypothetical protein
MQHTIDDLTLRADQQADALRKVAQDVPGIVQAVTLRDQQVKKIDTTLGDILARLPAITQKPNQPAPTLRSEGDLSARDWITIQTNLVRQGYGLGKIDGVPGGKTRRAIRAYQTSINANDKLTPEQIESLLGSRP